MTPNPNPRKASAEERIMATAAGLFATFGYNGVSTRDIASGASVNEVTIYRHHPRKRDLYMAVLEAELKQVILRGDLLARVAEASDGKMALARTFELISATMTHRPEMIRLMQFSALELGEDINPLLRRHLGEFIEVVARYLEPWAGVGARRGANAKAVVLALISFAVNYSSLHRMFLNGSSVPNAVVSAYADFCDILMDKADPLCNTGETPPARVITD